MPSFVEGVDIDAVAREWRLKWAEENDKASLAEVQKVLVSVLPELKAESGSTHIQRIVCGGCQDYKIITALPVEKWAEWEAKEFAPEKKFLEAVAKIEGVKRIETQNYALSPVE